MKQTTREKELEQAIKEVFAISQGKYCTELELNRIRSICRKELEKNV